MSTAPLVFTGVSTYSNDLQSILTRAVQIAQIPITRMQNDQSDLLQKKQLLTGLNTAVASVATSLGNLGSVAATKGLTVSSSNPSLVSVVNTGATSATNYTISNITSVAAAASETSLSGYATPDKDTVSSGGTLNLVVGLKTIPITLSTAQNNLNGLRDAINSANAGVTATILSTGTGANSYYLSVSANTTGQTTLQLNDVPSSGSPVNLLTNTNQGANAVFQLNGVNVSQSSNTVSGVIPGVTFTVLATTAPNQTVALSANTDRSQLSNALQDFANNYNSLLSQVNAQVGPAAGLLSGDYLIRQVETDLQQTASYQGSGGSIKGLANLGLSLDTTGKMSFDANTFDSLTDSQISDAFAFVGSTTTGLGALAKNFTQLSDPVSGLIKSQEDGYDQTYSSLTDRINAAKDQLNTMQTNLSARLQQADALLAQLQSQQQVLTASVQSVDYALYGKNFGVTTNGG
jgi:flagellar hook-associated protein 2